MQLIRTKIFRSDMGEQMQLVQKKRKQQYIKAYCLMYMWYLYEAHCEWVEAVSYGPAGARPKADGLKHGRHCLKWLLEYDAQSNSGETYLWDMVKKRKKERKNKNG